MLGHGPEVSQQLLNKEIYDFFSAALISEKDPSIEAQGAFLEHIEHIIRHCENPRALSLNEALLINEQSFLPTYLVQSLRLFIIEEGFHKLSDQLGVRFSQLEAPYQFPLQLKQNAQELIDENGRKFQITKKLEGRGQAADAFFCTDENREILVKVDDPATCICEGTADFVNKASLLPKTLQDCVNYASVGVLSKNDGPTSVVSIQDRVMPTEQNGKVRPWDEIVYGVKRYPKTLWSYESWYPESIKQSIAALPPNVKWQLGASLFACAVAGDESLHVGQFMALLDKDNNITGIKRIDLGARERYALARSKTGQHNPYHDSTQYQASGQWGKDYVSYLLADPSLRQIYTMLWLNLNAQDEDKLMANILASSKNAFLSQFQNIPVELHEKTLSDILEVVNKGLKSDKMVLTGSSVEERIISLAEQMAQIDAKRTIDMLKEIRQEYAKESQLEFQRFHLMDNDKDRACYQQLEKASMLKHGILFPEQDSIVQTEQVYPLIENFDAKIDELMILCADSYATKENYKKIELISDMSVSLLQAAYLRLLNDTQDKNQNKEQLKMLEARIDQFQTFSDLAHYCAHTSSNAKIPYAMRAMNMLRKGNTALAIYIANPDFISHITTHSSNIGYASSFVMTSQAQGEILLRKLFKRYHLDEAPIMLTEKARELLKHIQENRLQDVEKAINDYNFNVNDALIPDTTGMTALHYLMANENLDEHGLNAIVIFLTKTLGRTYNTPIDIPNRDGKTPLDLLLQNPKAKEIIEKINNSHIRGYTAEYAVHDFFMMKKYDAKTAEALHKLEPPKQAAKSSWW